MHLPHEVADFQSEFIAVLPISISISVSAKESFVCLDSATSFLILDQLNLKKYQTFLLEITTLCFWYFIHFHKITGDRDYFLAAPFFPPPIKNASILQF